MHTHKLYYNIYNNPVYIPSIQKCILLYLVKVFAFIMCSALYHVYPRCCTACQLRLNFTKQRTDSPRRSVI